MQIVIPATAAGIVIQPKVQPPHHRPQDPRRIVIQNPEENAFNITVHQGFEGSIDTDPIQLKPGDSFSLAAQLPVFLGTVGNVGGNARYNFFC